MDFVNSDQFFEFPVDVAVCPICNAPVIAYFDEYETDTGIVTDCGFHIDCKNEPELGDSDTWKNWFSSHWSEPYTDWLPLERRLYKWFTARYRVRIEGME